MTIEEIRAGIEVSDTLTLEEKKELVQGILNNEEAKGIAIDGAYSEGDWGLIFQITTGQIKL